jgi:hypothetical protein
MSEWRALAATVLYGLADRFCLSPNIDTHDCAIHGPNTIRPVNPRGYACVYCADVVPASVPERAHVA